MIELIWNSRSILLPSPEFGNTVSIALRTIIHQAMNGDYWTYLQRPNQKQFSMQINHLNRNKALEFESFVVATVGQRILLKDHNDEVWSVRVLNPFNSAHQAIRNSQVQLDFEVTDH